MNPSLPGPSSFKAARRGGELVTLLIRFGFSELVTRTGLRTYLPRGADADPAHDQQPVPVRVRLLLEHLGPTFIKAGQVLATRPDLVPPDFVAEFKKLQSNVPPAPWDGDDPDQHVRARLRVELGDRIETHFQNLDPEPLAAASVAQVHAAELIDGTPVVLKILRPGIRGVMAADLQLMRWIAQIAAGYFQNLGFDAEQVVDEFADQLDRETDLTVEKDSTRRMAADFAEDDGVDFPGVYPELTTRGVLTLERVQHRTLLAHLDPATLTDDTRTALVANAANAVFRQCLSLGFFHADPHPGNIFVDEQTGALTFIDCGMVGSIDPRSAEQLAQITHGTIEGELDRVVRTAIKIADADPGILDDRSFRADVWQFIDHFKGGSLASLRMGRMLDEFFEVMRKHQLRCPADIVYLIKALTTIEGVAKDLAPQFDLVGHVRPYVDKLVKRRFGLSALRRRLRNNAVAYADLLDGLPYEIGDLLRMIRQNRMTLHLEHDNLHGLTRELEQASRNISWALVIASIILGAAVLVLADQMDGDSSHMSTAAFLGFLLAVGFGLARIVFFRGDRDHD
jgi:ubiquinone biosynthesis protein